MTKNSLILCIETTTEVCSVAIAENGQCIAELSVNEPNAHSHQLTLLIQKILRNSNLHFGDLTAVAYSCGPGSYTGLRIGLSTAKGICMGSEIPLISISTLMHMTAMAGQMDAKAEVFLPMLDARRMEVYTSVINRELEILTEPFPCLLEEYSWDLLNKYHSIAYFGNGAAKATSVLGARPQFKHIDQFRLSASSMVSLAHSKFIHGEFANLAMEVPFYLKAANITESKKSPL